MESGDAGTGWSKPGGEREREREREKEREKERGRDERAKIFYCNTPGCHYSLYKHSDSAHSNKHVYIALPGSHYHARARIGYITGLLRLLEVACFASNLGGRTAGGLVGGGYEADNKIE